MMERSFVKNNTKEFLIQEFISENLKGIGHSHTKLTKTPLGEKIIIHASKPGLVVGRKGKNIKDLTNTLKRKFNLENPQIEIMEVPNVDLDANIVAERIVNSLERFGSARFKSIGHKVMMDVMKAGARGIEIVIGGRGVPSERAKSWRFYIGYLKKCGDTALSQVKVARIPAHLKSGTIGVKVSIMPPDVALPDEIIIDGEKNKEAQRINLELKQKELEMMENNEKNK